MVQGDANDGGRPSSEDCELHGKILLSRGRIAYEWMERSIEGVSQVKVLFVSNGQPHSQGKCLWYL